MQDEINRVIVDLPLYEEYKLNEENVEILKRIFFKSVTVDLYCNECEKETPFRTIEDYYPGLQNNYRSYMSNNGYSFENNLLIFSNIDPLNLIFTCQRNSNHQVFYTFIVRGSSLIKIGQYPSIATMDQNKIKKYKKVLSKERRNELSTAIGLVSHGVGVGSFVYLRRIFEDLIEESHQLALQEVDWDEEVYVKQRMNEKIKILEKYLPSFLVENREIYGILSKGIHELTEKECLNMFDGLKYAIEIILNQKIHKLEQQEKEQQIRKFIQEQAEALKK